MPFVLAVDYDGTIITKHRYPCKEVIDKVKEFKKFGSEIVLWTCREGRLLDEAVAKCKEFGLEFDAVNSNAPSQLEYMKTMAEKGEALALRKIFANFYVDDRALNIDRFLEIDVEKTCNKFNNY